MPTINLRFDPPQESVEENAPEYVEFNVIWDRRTYKIAASLRLCTIDGVVGFSREEWQEQNDAMPPHVHEPWSTERSPWFTCADGIA